MCDLYCGLGGFSAGALRAGATVVVGVDNDYVPLKLFGANLPGSQVALATLGPGGDSADLPPPATDLHVHLSPPCTDLSPARNGSDACVERGTQMLRWSIEFVLTRGDYSWSIENVSTPHTRAVLEEYAALHPDRVACATLDASEFGAPQTRSRLIAGPPRLIRRLLEMPAARRLSVRDAFAAQDRSLPAEHIKNQTRGRDGKPCVRSVEQQSFTVCASHGLTWCDAAGETVKTMSAQDSALLMGFETSWRLPARSRDAQRAVGNAVCVALSEAVVRAALSVAENSAADQPNARETSL